MLPQFPKRKYLKNEESACGLTVLINQKWKTMEKIYNLAKDIYKGRTFILSNVIGFLRNSHYHFHDTGFAECKENQNTQNIVPFTTFFSPSKKTKLVSIVILYLPLLQL